MRENILVLRKHTLKYYGVNGHDICNLLFNASEKNYIDRENNHANVATCQILMNLVKGYTGVLCTVPAPFLLS